ARDLHGTLYAKICPSETPEGQSTSLVKNLALMAEITTEDIDKEKIKAQLEEMGVSLKNKGKVGVYIDGEYVGNYEDGYELFKKLVRLRRDGLLSSSINFHFRDYINEFNINTTKGRIRHPYIVVENGKPLLNTNILKRIKEGKMRWEHLVKTGIVEYLDAEEEENALIAKSMDEVNEKHTHVEIEPSSIFGAVAGLLPYPEYNSSPRLTMASSMLKQSLGLYASNYNLRFDTKGYVMYYPQKPIASTAVYDALKLEKRAAGQNFVVAVMSYRGWNMADAVVINKSAIDRGLGRAVMFKTYQTEEAQYPGGYTDKITVPTHKVIGYKGEEAYQALDEDGVAKVEAEVKEGDVIIGKISPPRFMEELSIFGIVDEKMRDTSVQLKEGEHGRVDKVIITSGSSGNKLIKVRVRMNKIPEIGDKFSSRHGQKGVIGMVLPQEDMPFTKDGIVPDLIINPHAIPSRMTAGHLLEMLGVKWASITGNTVDATPFSGDRLEKFTKELKELGFDEWGEEEMYDGITGQKIKVKIFVGVIYYERLHHLVSNKIHSRTRGPVQLLTAQPTEGRSREGGLRFGEMERDTLIGHGAVAAIRDRLLENSDKANIYVCRDCGAFAYYDYQKETLICPVCKSTNIGEVEMPYSFKLLLEEIKSLHIYPRLLVGKKGEEDE
ncbi:MAG: DNA-directed RNA polymerase subunit B, partial [Candidatus Micrarchaeota archaeon]|nr:DNA-directed RNA polymerase subunit B [Candidatus Micrarchaeota archaeon]